MWWKIGFFTFVNTTYLALSSEAGKPSLESSSHIHLSTEVAMFGNVSFRTKSVTNPDFISSSGYQV